VGGGRGVDDQKNDMNDEDDKDGTASKEEEDSVEKEEQEFTRWFGSLKDEENVQPKEEAVQVDSTRTRYALLTVYVMVLYRVDLCLSLCVVADTDKQLFVQRVVISTTLSVYSGQELHLFMFLSAYHCVAHTLSPHLSLELHTPPLPAPFPLLPPCYPLFALYTSHSLLPTFTPPVPPRPVSISAAQEALRTAVGSMLSTSKREALLR
jgi:hypothetical protein